MASDCFSLIRLTYNFLLTYLASVSDKIYKMDGMLMMFHLQNKVEEGHKDHEVVNQATCEVSFNLIQCSHHCLIRTSDRDVGHLVRNLSVYPLHDALQLCARA